VIEYEGEQMGPSLALDTFVYLSRFYCGCLGSEAKSLANGKVVELHFGFVNLHSADAVATSRQYYIEKRKKKKKKAVKKNVKFTTSIQQSHNNLLHEGGLHTLGSTLI
jgi:hypothetical protein